MPRTTQAMPRLTRALGFLAVAAAALAAAAPETAAAPACKPKRPRPAVVLKSMGPCAFDASSLSFAGSPAEQAACLMRGMDRTRNLGPSPAALPPALAERIGARARLPEPDALAAYILSEGLAWDIAGGLWYGLSRARDNDVAAPAARYFVIHDTSGPNFGRRAFPSNTDDGARFNDLRNFKCGDGWEKAHAVINRRGDILYGHDFGIPWRETKFERALNFEGALKGLFLHVEMIQPRRRGRGWRGGDTQTPHPPFTAAQYRRLALLYMAASVRAGMWMIPAFHAAIDSGIRGGHDDPLGFDIAAFDASLTALIERVHARPQTVSAGAP